MLCCSIGVSLICANKEIYYYYYYYYYYTINIVFFSVFTLLEIRINFYILFLKVKQITYRLTYRSSTDR